MSDHLRTCVGCRRTAPRDELVRLVAVDGCVVVDPSRTLPGRGASLHPGPDCLAVALKRRALQRALRGASVDEPGLTQHPVFA